jgi:hypothetical protein
MRLVSRFFFTFRGSSKMIRARVATFALMMACLAGCGGGSGRPELVPVQGTVNFKGAPLAGATVTFYCEKSPRSAMGITDANGKFSLTTYDTNDGAVPGEHSVSITKVKASDSSGPITQENAKEKMAKDMQMMIKGNPGDVKAELDLPARYADAKTSGEKRTVVKGDVNDFKFELTD